MNYLDIIYKIVYSASNLGSINLKNGTILLGSVPHIAQNAWLHQIFSGLEIDALETLEKKLKREIPSEYRFFLSKMNGAGFFSESLSLYGFRENYSRDEENIWQPFDLLVPNTYERLNDANENLFFIGSYSWDGSLLYIDSLSNEVFRCLRDSARPLNQWPSFEIMIVSELTRLSKLFSKQGILLEDSIPTVPTPQRHPF